MRPKPIPEIDAREKNCAQMPFTIAASGTRTTSKCVGSNCMAWVVDRIVAGEQIGHCGMVKED
jgi:hypothetical protein